MAHLQDGVALDRQFDDIDDLASALPGWTLEFTRLSAGPVGARLHSAGTAGMQLTRFTLDAAALATGSIPRHTSGIALIFSAPGPVRSRGRALDPRTMAPGRMLGQEVHFLASSAIDMMVVEADHAVFEGSLRAFAGVESRALGADWWFRPPPGTADCPERGEAIVALQSILARGRIFSEAARHRLQECVLQILLGDFAADLGPTLPISAPTRRRVARAAEAVMRERLDDPPSLRELCELIGVPERTLHHAFQDSFGMAPKAYLRALRLNAAHRRLRRGLGTVTEAATDLGLFHFGRFATEYRAMFGETPSTTLRDARGRPG